jgi:hypothetical protein
LLTLLYICFLCPVWEILTLISIEDQKSSFFLLGFSVKRNRYPRQFTGYPQAFRSRFDVNIRKAMSMAVFRRKITVEKIIF